MIKFANTSNRGRVCLFSQKETTILDLKNVQFELRRVLSSLLAVRTSTVAAAFKRKKIITSTYNLKASSKRLKFLSRINKINCDFLYRQSLTLVCRLRNHVT